MNNNSRELVTLVTGLWDIKRNTLSEGWARTYGHYLDKLNDLLSYEGNLIVFGEPELEEFIFNKRNSSNTQFISRNTEWFLETVPYEKIQSIRRDPKWFNQTGWLPDSTQARLEMYNPLVMSKMFLLNDASILSKFNSEFFFWIDAGISNTVHTGYFTHDKVLDRIPSLISKFTFICFPYTTETEIHGFTYPDINNFAGKEVKLVARGGFFGGPKEFIHEINALYYSELYDTIGKGYMGTEESIFSILTYKYPSLVDFCEIKEDGLLFTFFEDLKNNRLEIKNTSADFKKEKKKPLNNIKTALYVISYNSPKQFETLCKSFQEYDNDFLTKTTKILLNNSIDRTTDIEYERLCQMYGFEEIKKDNLGICGGRQFIAEHFESQNDMDYYLFFEDDMFFYCGNEVNCSNGFIRKVNNLFSKAVKIVHKESLDFFKLNFTEFYGDNQLQWGWHNIPSETRRELFPNNPYKETSSYKEAPYIEYSSIRSYDGLPYALGEVFYCNWPQIVSRLGNKKMFLDTKWEYPYEQTWMSHIFQETKKKNITAGVLLATPTLHNRFDHYPAEERKEN